MEIGQKSRVLRGGDRCAGSTGTCHALQGHHHQEGEAMAKGLDKKKEQKKKPAKTLKEKRADKSDKKNTRGSMPG